jgi:hypothetical protein
MKTECLPKIIVPPVGKTDCQCGHPGVRRKGKDWVCAGCVELETQAAGFERRRAFAGKEDR